MRAHACRAQHVSGGAPFGRIDSPECSRDAGHGGRHSWEVQDAHELAQLRSQLGAALARLDAVGEVVDEADCECPCACCDRKHAPDCSLCLACLVDRAAFGGAR